MKSIERSVLHKTKKIFEQLSGKYISLKFTDIDRPAVEIKERSAEILMPRYSNEPWKFYYRRFEHEISHVVFKTPDMDKAVDIIRKEINVESHTYLSIIIRYLLNIIEDYRVDWMWNRFYRGSKVVREEQLKAVAKDLIISDHIIDILNAVRCDPDVLNEISDPELKEVCREFLKILKTVEGKSWKASIVATVETLKLLEKYFKRNVYVVVGSESDTQDEVEEVSEIRVTVTKEIREREGGQEEDTKNEQGSERGNEHGKRQGDEQEETGEKEERGENNQGTGEKNQEEEETEKENQEKEETGEENQEEVTEKKLSEYIDSKELESILPDSVKSLPKTEYESITNQNDIDESIFEKPVREILGEAELEGLKMLKEIEKKLKKIKSINPNNFEKKNIFVRTSSDIQFYSRPHSKPDTILADRIAKVLNKIKNKMRVDNDITGLDFDIDETIKHKVTKNGLPFENEEIDTGFDIVILLDASSSMEGDKISIASSACATLFLALQKVKNVSMRVIAFSCEKGGNPVYLRELKTVEEICSVFPDNYTPTWAAVHYAVNLLNKSTAQRKMIVLITDGAPENGRYPSDILFEWTREAIERARRSGINVYTLFIDVEVSETIMRRVFGPEWTWEEVVDIEQLPKRLFNLVINKIVR